MKKIMAYFLQGLLAILPLVITIYLLVWLGTTAESFVGGALKKILPDKMYIPGMGVLVGFVLILLLGILLKLWLFRKIFELLEKIVEKTPVVKSIYNSIKDLTGFFDNKKEKSFNKVVRLNLMDGKIRLIGLVTREDFSKAPNGIADDDSIAVYLPMSYQVGGYMVVVSKSQCTPINNMSVEEAMRFTLTAGVSTEQKK
jgi:uncharacterized membrane protein